MIPTRLEEEEEEEGIPWWEPWPIWFEQREDVMRIELKEEGIAIVPENDQDKAYIKDTLGMTEHGSCRTLMLHKRGNLIEDVHLETVADVKEEK